MNTGILFSAFLAVILSIFLLSPFTKMSNLRQSTDTADLLVANAFIYTSDPSLPYADSMAVKDGRIVRVGNYSFVQKAPGLKSGI